jgi:hypothetical protein
MSYPTTRLVSCLSLGLKAIVSVSSILAIFLSNMYMHTVDFDISWIIYIIVIDVFGLNLFCVI